MVSQQKAGQWSHQSQLQGHWSTQCWWQVLPHGGGHSVHEWQFEMLLENFTHWHPGILGGILEGFFDNILRKPGKVGAKLSGILLVFEFWCSWA
jgi:hypothetical protein